MNSSAPVGSLPTGTLLNGIYEIEAKIAAGGMGEVYRGRNIHSGDRVAIKVVRIDVGDDDHVLTMFRREAMALNGLEHPAIIRYHLFSFDQTVGRYYLAMEFVEGRSLKDIVAERPLPFESILRLGRRIGAGLDAAHRLGVVHRDVAPDNIILPADDPGRAKIIDFGIARQTAFKADGTVIGDGFAGKYNYVSPEQLGLFGGDVTWASDYYSLGLVLAEAATGRALDMRGNPAEVVEKRRRVPDLSGVDPRLRPLLTALLAPDPGDRPANWQVLERLFDAAESRPGSSSAGPRADPPADATIVAPAPPGGAPREPTRSAFGLGALADRAPAPPPPQPPPTSAWTSEARGPEPARPRAPAPAPKAAATAPPLGRRPVLLVGVAAGVVGLVAVVAITWYFARPPEMPGSPGSAPAQVSVVPEASPPVAPPVGDRAPAASSPEGEVKSNDAMASMRIESAGPADIDRYLADYAKANCIHLEPMTTEVGAATTEAFGTSVRPFEVLDVDFKRTFGFSIDIHVHPVMAEHCPLIDRLAKARRDGVPEPKLEIVSSSVPKGGYLAGEVAAEFGWYVGVGLAEDDGMMRPLVVQRQEGPDGAPIPFLARLEPRTAGGDKPQLVVAIASQTPFPVLQDDRSVAIGPFLEALGRSQPGADRLAMAARYVVVKR